MSSIVIFFNLGIFLCNDAFNRYIAFDDPDVRNIERRIFVAKIKQADFKICIRAERAVFLPCDINRVRRSAR